MDQAELEGSKHHTAPSSSIGAMSMPPRPEKRYILPFNTADALPTRGVGAEETSFVSKRFASVASLVLYLDGLTMRGSNTRLERDNIDFIIQRLPWLHFTTEDADMIVDNGKDLGRSAQTFVVEKTLPGTFERADGHHGHRCSL